VALEETEKMSNNIEPIEYIVKWENCFKEQFELTFSAYRQAKTCADYNNGKIFDKSGNEITEQNSCKYVWKEMEMLGVPYPKI